MIKACNKGVSDYLVQSGSTIRNWVEEEFVYAIIEIEKLLAMAFSKIRISFDLWTSPNRYTFYGIVVHLVG